MSRTRMALRGALAQLVRDADTLLESRVTTSRDIAWRLDDMPSAAVYTVSDRTEGTYSSKETLRRTAQLSVDIVSSSSKAAADSLGLDDHLEEIAHTVEQAVAFQPFLGDLAARRVHVTDVQGPELRTEGAEPIGALTLTFQVTYLEPYPDAGADTPHRLDEVGVTWNTDPTNTELDEAIDEILAP